MAIATTQVNLVQPAPLWNRIPAVADIDNCWHVIAMTEPSQRTTALLPSQLN